MNVGHQRHSAAGDDDKINHWAAWSTGMRNTHETWKTCLPVRPVWDTFTGSLWTMGMRGALAGVGWRLCLFLCLSLVSFMCIRYWRVELSRVLCKESGVLFCVPCNIWDLCCTILHPTKSLNHHNWLGKSTMRGMYSWNELSICRVNSNALFANHLFLLKRSRQNAKTTLHCT